jgi:hypothetical protein
VRPPGAPDWERTALAWLFDECPPDYRALPVLRQHPVALAWLAGRHVAGQQEACRRAMATARADLGDAVPPPVMEALLAGIETEAARLLRSSRAVALVEQALRGRRFAPRL